MSLSLIHQSIVSLLFVLYLNPCIYLIHAATPSSTYKSSCALLENRMYCYSGGTMPLDDRSIARAVDEHHFLDLAQTLVVGFLSAKWISLPQDPNYIEEPALASAVASISNTTYIVDGGYNETPVVNNFTRLFNTETNQWTTISNENRNISGAIYMGTAVNVPSQGRIYYWGGLHGRYPGYPVNDTTVLHVTQNFAWSICPGVLPPGAHTRFGHTATLDNDGINIFYLGGKIRTAGYDTSLNYTTTGSFSQRLTPYSFIPMTEILTYNTIDASWSLSNSPSPSTMANRYLHTATLLPNSGKILIYGGATDDGAEKIPSPVPDYLYLFDPKTLEYAMKDDNKEEDQGAGPRFGHSVVLCKNTLIILFGINRNSQLTNDVYFLSIAGSTKWLKSFSVLGDDSNNKLDPPAVVLDDRAIIGITIGSVLVMALLITGIAFMLYKRKSKKKQEQDKLDKPDNSSTADQNLPQLYKEYQRFSSSATLDNHLPNEYSFVTSGGDGVGGASSTLPIYVDISSDSATLHDNTSPPRGFSFDHIVAPIMNKPNQVRNQQLLSFSSSDSLQQATDANHAPTTDTLLTPSPAVVKPSL